MKNIFQKIKHVADNHPLKRAVIVVDKAGNESRTVSYQTLVVDVEACARSLLRSGIAPEETVAVVFPNSYDFVVAVLAVFAIGGRLLPLNPGFREDEIIYCLNSTATRAIFYPKGLDTVASYIEEKGVAAFCHTNFAQEPEDLSINLPLLTAEDSGCGGVYMFSSGSTGKSKRISRSQQDILHEFDMLAQTVSLSDDEEDSWD